MTTQEKEARRIARRAAKNNTNPADEIAALEALERRPLVSVGRRPKSVELPKRPRRPAFTQGTVGRRHRLAVTIQRLRAMRRQHAAAVKSGDATYSNYKATWGTGDGQLRRLAEEIVRDNLTLSDRQIFERLRGIV